MKVRRFLIVRLIVLIFTMIGLAQLHAGFESIAFQVRNLCGGGLFYYDVFKGNRLLI